MLIADLLKNLKFLPASKKMELYPPFFFMGVKLTKVSDDFRYLKAEVPLRWYGKNMHGSMFGGFLCAATDPLAALMCERIFPGHSVLTKSHLVEFLKPSRSKVIFEIEISHAHVKAMEEALKETGSARPIFKFDLKDTRGRVVARVKNEVFVRSRPTRPKKRSKTKRSKKK